jgi:hypothetical protein
MKKARSFGWKAPLLGGLMLSSIAFLPQLAKAEFITRQGARIPDCIVQSYEESFGMRFSKSRSFPTVVFCNGKYQTAESRDELPTIDISLGDEVNEDGGAIPCYERVNFGLREYDATVARIDAEGLKEAEHYWGIRARTLSGRQWETLENAVGFCSSEDYRGRGGDLSKDSIKDLEWMLGNRAWLLTNPFKTHACSMLAKYKQYPMSSDPEMMYMIAVNDSKRTFFGRILEAGEKLAAWLGIGLGMILLGMGVANGGGTASRGMDPADKHADQCERGLALRETFGRIREETRERNEERDYNNKWGRGD